MATSITGNNPFWGMIIYEKTGDGTLSGTWKNKGLSNDDSALGETAIKNDGNPTIDGSYNVSWIEEDNQVHNGILIIAITEQNASLSFIWLKDNKEVFRGMGMPIGLNQIAVTYWDTPGALRLNF